VTRAMKRLMDILCSAVALLLLSPLIAALAIAVRVSSEGPVFFRQWRLGRHGAPFSILKFRTMVQNAPDLRNPDGSTSSGPADPRVTPLGRWLRATSLDELPQLWNVLIGEMSLVGPRPDQVDQLRFYTTEERSKLNVRPGMTGLAQISGRNSISWERRKALDREYVAHWSLEMDLAILCKTIPYVLRRADIHEKVLG
jgi:lipopolysaccharide/colanic/teichoic acid biosynthesis glycosyltransferase